MTDGGATPMQGVNVRLFPDVNLDGISDGGSPIRNVNTNSSGIYSMATITPGQYVIVLTLPPGYTLVSGADTTVDAIPDVGIDLSPSDIVIPATIHPQEIDSDNTFILARIPGSITGSVFTDVDNNELPDEGDGVEGVTINLFADYNEDGLADDVDPIDSTVTDEDGNYSFTNLSAIPGENSYLIVIEVPEGYILKKDKDSTIDGDDVVNSSSTDGVIPVTITTNETDANNYFILESI